MSDPLHCVEAQVLSASVFSVVHGSVPLGGGGCSLDFAFASPSALHTRYLTLLKVELSDAIFLRSSEH